MSLAGFVVREALTHVENAHPSLPRSTARGRSGRGSGPHSLFVSTISGQKKYSFGSRTLKAVLWDSGFRS